MNSPSPILIYQTLMEDIKKRIKCLQRIATGSLSLGDDRFNLELGSPAANGA